MELQFRSVCRLNRLLVLTMIAFTVNQDWSRVHLNWTGNLLVVGLVILYFAFLMGNEFLLKMIKRLRDAELQTVNHFSIFLPLSLTICIAISYLATGNLFIYLLGIFTLLQAQFLNQTKLSHILGLFWGVLFLLTSPFGYPHGITLTHTQMTVVVLGWGTCFYYYGMVVSQLVRSHTSQVGRLQSMAATDELTGLTNRRQFNNRLNEEVARARRHETPLSLALFDLDDFKRLNDFYGHPVGDRILKELGKLICQNIRESDLSARYGGEEFALILPETRELEAYELLERLRLLVAQTVFCLPENPLTITISVGVAQLEPRQNAAFELVELADKALYEAKKQGKNRVVQASSLMPKVLLSKKPLSQLFRGV